MSNSKKTVWILSIDGGGIRGILPLSILKYIEEKTESLIPDLFDVIGGTSTGGIIALGLNSKKPGTDQRYRAEDLLEFYVKDALKIFEKNYDSSWEWIASLIRDKIASEIPGLKQFAGKRGAGLFTPEYSGKAIEAFLKDKFGSEIKLSQLPTQCDVTVYSYDIENDEIYRFNNKKATPNHQHDCQDDYYVWQAARATSAAPTFFSGLEVFNSNSGLRFGTYDSPALAVYQDKLYMAWRGAGAGKDKIYYASFDGKNWSDQVRAGNFEISENSNPALAVHQNKLYLAWRGVGDGKKKIYYASFDGKDWSVQNQADDFVINENSSPALAVYQDKLYLTWCGADEGIYYASFEGEKWSKQNRADQFGISHNSSPTLAVHQNKLYLAWRGAGDGKKKIYYASFDGKDWSVQNRADDFVINENSSPALAVYQDKLYLTWCGAEEGIYYASFNGKKWLDQNRASSFKISKNSSPALAVAQGKLYLAWRGADRNDDKIYYASLESTNWSMQRRVPSFRTLVDGGIYINNPALDLFIRAKNLYPDAEKFKLVSLGTGDFLESRPELKNQGFLFSWMKSVISYAMKGNSATVHDHLDKLLGNSPGLIESSLNKESSYYRFEPYFDENIEMDAIEEQDIQRLQKLGKKLVEDKKSDLDRLIDQLKPDP